MREEGAQKHTRDHACGMKWYTVGSTTAMDEEHFSHVPRPSFKLQILSLSHALYPSLSLSLSLSLFFSLSGPLTQFKSKQPDTSSCSLSGTVDSPVSRTGLVMTTF